MVTTTPAGNSNGKPTAKNPKSPLRVSAVWTTLVFLILGILSSVFIWSGTPTPDSLARTWDYNIPSASGQNARAADSAPGNGLGIENPTRSAGEIYQELSKEKVALFIEHYDALAAGLTVLDPTGKTPWLSDYRDQLAPEPGKPRVLLFKNTYCATIYERGEKCPYLPDNFQVAGISDGPLDPRGRQFAVIPAAEDQLGYGSYLLGASEEKAQEVLPEVFTKQFPAEHTTPFGIFLVALLEYDGFYAILPLISALFISIFIFAMEYRRNTNFPAPNRSGLSAKDFAFAHFPAHLIGFIGGMILGLIPLIWFTISQGNSHLLRAYLPHAAWVSVAVTLVVMGIFLYLRVRIARHYQRRLQLLHSPGKPDAQANDSQANNPQGGAH